MMRRLPDSATEHQIQSAFFSWWNMVYRLPLAWAIPNGGKRHPAVGRKLREEGVRPGVPDVFIAIPTPQFSGLFLEFKSRRGAVTAEQKVLHERLRFMGYAVEVVRSVDQAISVTENYLLPVQEMFAKTH
jgi:hypothetical protein